MILGLYGHSCTGKTTVARVLAQTFRLPLRSCGEEVKLAASHLGVTFEELPPLSHRAIDAETLRWGLVTEIGIIEGRFLDFVLYPLSEVVHLACITASIDKRMHRWAAKHNQSYNENAIHCADASDAEFIDRMYIRACRSAPRHTLDTSDLTTAECATLLAPYLEAIKP